MPDGNYSGIAHPGTSTIKLIKRMKQGCSTKFVRILTSAMLLVATVGGVISSSPDLMADCAPPPAGLVAWWPGEGNANEVIGETTGLVYPGTGYTNGEAGQGFSFDGATSCVMNTNTPPMTNIQNTFTMEFWAYPQKGFDMAAGDGSGYPGISGQSYAIFPDWGGLDGPAGVGVCVGTNGISVIEHAHDYMPSMLSYTNQINNWIHIAVVYVNKQPTLYVNGVKVGTGITSSRSFVYPSKDLGNSYGSVFGHPFNAYGPYHGLLDEVAIYNRALSTNEIAAIYAAGSAGKCAPTVASCATPPANLVAWWPGAGNGNDIAGGHTAAVPATGVTFSNAEVGLGFSFDGSTNQMAAPDAPDLNFGAGQDLSIEAWILPQHAPGNSPADEMTIAYKRYAANAYQYIGYAFYIANNGQIFFLMGDAPLSVGGVIVNAGPDLRDGKFHHVAVTVQRNSATGGHLYVDGANVLTFDPTSHSGSLSNSEPFIIGSQSTPGYRTPFKGIIDDLSLYKRALSSNEIAAIYAAGSAGKCVPAVASCATPPANLVAWWPGEANAQDVVGGSSGTVMGGTTFATGEVGQSFSFNGTSNSVSVADSALLDSLTNKITIELWLKANSLSANPDWQGIVTKGNNSWRLQATSLAKTVYLGLNGVTPSDIYGTRIVNDGQWHHVAAVYDGTNMSLYVDGTLDVTQPATGTIAQNNDSLCIGANAKAYVPSCGCQKLGYFYNGLIDEVSLYNRALTANEIAAIYVAGSAGKCAPTVASCATPPANLVAWWPGAGNGNDIVGGNNGSWAGFGSLNSYDSGTVGQALVFDGTHRDRVDVGNPASLQLQNLTIEAWIKRSSATIASLDDNFADGSIAGPGAYIFGYGAGGYGLFLLDAGEMGLTKNSYGDVHVAPVITDTNWHHVAVTKSGTNVVFYVDGAMLPAPGPYSDTFQFTTSAAIGSRGDGGGNTFYGKVDELSIYNRALSSNEIAAIYAAGSAGKCSPATPVVISGPITNSANGHSYFLLGSSTWTEAEAKAVTLGGHLVTINDAAENAWVLSTFGNGGTRALWIGLNDAATEGSFVWASGDSSSYRNWSSGEPNNYGGIEDYAYMGYPTYANGTWNDQPDSGYNPVSGADNRPYMFGVVEISTGTNTAPQPPVITDFSPKFATNGTILTVTGTNFSPVATSNVVYFGAVRALVIAASSTTLQAIVPTGATFAPVTVTVNGLTAFSDQLFEPTFVGNGSSISTNSFKPSFNLAAGNGPGSAVIADLDGDGKPDIAAVNGYAKTLSIFRNLSSGGTLNATSFAPRVDLPFPTNGIGGDPYRLRVADLDGDGKLDLIACEISGSRVSIYRNLAVPGIITTNSFAAGFNLATGSDCRFAMSADFDNDGRVDIAALNYGDKTISIFKNIGSAGSLTASSFAPPVILAAPGGPYEAVAEDFDGDGKPDLAVANSDGGTVSIYQNLALTGVITTNSFAPRFDLPTGNTTATIVAVDLDGNGKLDLVAGSVQSHTISVFRNISTGYSLATNSFAARVDFLTDDWTHTLAIADFNGDGKPDISVVGELPSRMSIFQNLSVSGTFTSASLGSRVDFGTGWNAWGVAAGDLDGDGQPDIVFCNAYDTTMQIYQNASSSVSQPTTLPPVITDFFPKSGSNTIFVTVTGSNFSPAAVSNIVYFGAVRAVVSAATKTNLIVSVPVGATFAPLTVTVSGLTAFSKTKFMPTFAGSSSLLTTSSFAPRFNISNPGSGRTAIADLDGDGKPDMIVNNLTTHAVCLYRNISVSGSLTAGSFSPQVVIPSLPVADSPWDVQVADVDGDGKLDLILANRGANIVSILRNISTPGLLGTNSFAASVNLPGGNLPLNTAVRDVDGDGRADLIVADFNSGQVAIFKNLGSPGQLTTNSFAAPVFFPAQAGTDWIAVDDLDGDGKPDIAAANANANSVSILRNTSAIGAINTNSFAPQFSLSAPTYTHCVRIADIDGDGKLDMVAVSVLGQSLSVYRNIGSPGALTVNSFAPRVDFPLAGRGHTISFGDLNGDNKLDVVVETELSDSLAVFQNLSTPGSFTSASFAPRLNLPTGYNAAGSSVGDLDGDGRPDILFANSYDNNISIYRNLGPLPPTITQQPASQSVVLGDWVMFNVLATGTSPFSYQWRFNGNSLFGETNSSLILPEAQLAQAGNYSVTVANALGSVLSSNATLTVTMPVCTTAPAGLAAWWQGEGNTFDSAMTNNGILVGGVAYVSGKAGSGFHLNGTNAYLQIPDSAALKPTNLTVEAWVKFDVDASPNANLPGQQYIVFKKNTRSGNFEGYTLNRNRISGRDCFTFSITSAGGQQLYAASKTIPQVGLWYHLAGTYDRSTGYLKIFVNGVEEGSAYAGFNLDYDTRPLFIGTTGEYWDGKLQGTVDEVSIYNRALSTNEIAAIYAARGAGKCPLSPTVLNVTPPNWYVNEGATVSYTVTAVGSPVLTYQWQHNGSDIANATNATLTLSNVVYAQAGNYAVVVSNPAGFTTSSNVLLLVNRAPVADASATDTLAISPNGTNAVVVLDGSLSSDPDGDPLTYAWFNFGETNAFATSIVAMESLPVGTNQITLTVNDGMASGSQTIAVEVITTSQAVDRLIELVQSGSGNTQPLVASLRAALAAIDRSQPAVAINQLEAFINKVHVQLEPSDPVLAAQLIADAQAIIDALNGGTSVAVATVEITSLTPDHHGKAHLKIKGIKGRVHVIETSTNMVDWTPVGVAKQSADDSFEFDDSGAQDTGARFYRVVSPK